MSLLDLGDRAITPISDKAKTILNSINFEHLSPKKRPNLPLNGLVIGSMGLFRYKKGMVYLCKALGELKHKYEFTLLLAGDYFKEEDREPHLQYFRENGLEDRVIVTGFPIRKLRIICSSLTLWFFLRFFPKVARYRCWKVWR